MSLYVAVFFIQIAYWYIKIYNTKQIMSHNLAHKLLSSNLSNLVWLASITIGVGQLLEQDYFILVPFMLGGSVGVIIDYQLSKKGNNYVQ